jgi:MFS family permease
MSGPGDDANAAAPADAGRRDLKLRELSLAIFMMFLAGLGLAMSIPLLSLEMERGGLSGFTNGANTAVAGLATIIVAPRVPALVGRLGIAHTALVAIAAAAAILLAFAAAPFWVWFPLRFAFGAAVGTLFIVSEFWIVSLAPLNRRGLVMGVYATVLALGFAAGPSLLVLTGTVGLVPYLAGASIFTAGALPFLLARPARLAASPEAGAGALLAAIRVAPAATLAALLFGAVETAGFSLLPIYGVRLGFSGDVAAMLITALALGNVASQVAIGSIADRFGSGRLLMPIAVLGAVGALLIPLAFRAETGLLILLFLWGGIVGGLYTVGLTQLASRFPPEQLVGANAAFVMLYSIGSVAGPAIVGAAMDRLPPHGFAWSVALLFLLYLLFVTLLRRHRPAGPA